MNKTINQIEIEMKHKASMEVFLHPKMAIKNETKLVYLYGRQKMRVFFVGFLGCKKALISHLLDKNSKFRLVINFWQGFKLSTCYI